METFVYYIYRFLNLYYYLIFFYVILSWIPVVRYSKVYQFIGSIVEPYLRVFRRIIPPIGGLDFSPILAIIALNIASRGFVGLYNALL